MTDAYDLDDAVDEAIGSAGTAPSIRLPIPDGHVQWARGVVASRPFVSSLEEWEAEEPRGRGGRTRKVSYEAVLVALVLAARLNRPLLMTELTYILYEQISDEMRAALGLVDGPPAKGDRLGWAARYKNVRVRFLRMLWLMDPSPNPKNRRLGPAAFAAAMKKHEEAEATASREMRYARLSWFVNQFLEASFQQMPRHIRRKWKGSLCVDATKVEAFARPGRSTKGKKKDRQMMVSSADPDAAFYSRTRDGNYDEDPESMPKKESWYANELTIATIGPASEEEAGRFAQIALGMAVLHQPGTAPADRALEAIGSIRARGHDADFAAGDRLYSNCLPDEYHLKLRALGYKLTFDYRTDQLGLQGFVHGFIVVEGGIYSPSMPEALINATKDLRAGRISSGLYWERLAQRELYAARPKEAPDSEGHQRMQCPAAGSWPGARCDLKPASKDKPHTRTKRIHITDELKADADGRACCAQQSVTIAPEDAAKFRQELRFATVEWQSVYNTLRNTIEGYNGFIKDEAVEDVAAPQRRRIRGTAAQTVLVGMLVFAANLRKIDAYLAQAEPDADGELHKKPRRRKTKPIVAWMAPDLPLTRGPTPTPAAA